MIFTTKKRGLSTDKPRSILYQAWEANLYIIGIPPPPIPPISAPPALSSGISATTASVVKIPESIRKAKRHYYDNISVLTSSRYSSLFYSINQLARYVKRY